MRAITGEHVEAGVDREAPTNTLALRTYPAIYLGPTGNQQGNWNIEDQRLSNRASLPPGRGHVREGDLPDLLLHVP